VAVVKVGRARPCAEHPVPTRAVCFGLTVEVVRWVCDVGSCGAIYMCRCRAQVQETAEKLKELPDIDPDDVVTWAGDTFTWLSMANVQSQPQQSRVCIGSHRAAIFCSVKWEGFSMSATKHIHNLSMSYATHHKFDSSRYAKYRRSNSEIENTVLP
jgi:hypothetical protein